MQTAHPDVDTATFKRVMGRFPTGVAVITASDGGSPRGMTANAFMSASLTPPLCIVSIARRARMHVVLMGATHFGVNILAEGQEDISVHFAGGAPLPRPLDFDIGAETPLLRDACARIVAATVARHDCGDHTLMVGHIVFMEANERLPLLYHAGRYARLLPGRIDQPIAMPEFW